LEANGCAVSGDPKSVILEHASKLPADLVVVGSHGASKMTQFLLGNVAAAVVRHAPCSVIVARHGGPVRKLLLATDGSTHAEAAARSIAGRAWPEGTEVRILGVVEFVLPTYQVLLEPPFVHSAEADSIRVQALKHAQDAVARSVEILRNTGLEITESVSVLMENPRDVILKEAEEWGADVIVVGSHGRRGMERFLLGSVSEAIATRAGCSAEVIR
jgi:nucleotide-binding universal stress UspA family protein